MAQLNRPPVFCAVRLTRKLVHAGIGDGDGVIASQIPDNAYWPQAVRRAQVQHLLDDLRSRAIGRIFRSCLAILEACQTVLSMGRPPAIETSAEKVIKDIRRVTRKQHGAEEKIRAINLIRQYDLILPVLGLLVSFLSALVSLLVGLKLMKIETPILLGIIAGQHCSTPAISALVSQAGNSIPMGPIVVAMGRALAS